jgi:DNA-binding IclR family transcriptional regulator
MVMPANRRPKKRDGGVQAVETAFEVLLPLLAATEAQGLSTIARQAKMPAAKVHRYLVSLIRAGAVVQDPESGRYDLGPVAIRLGLATLNRFDTVRYAMSDLQRLRDQVDETVSVIVWDNAGPTVVRTDNSMHEVSLTMRVGTILPLFRSASGRLFLTFLPADRLAAHLSSHENARIHDPVPSDKKRSAIAAETRRRGLARTIGGVLAGVSALAAPIFDEHRNIVAVVTAFGRSATFDATWDGPLADALKTFAKTLSVIRATNPG